MYDGAQKLALVANRPNVYVSQFLNFSCHCNLQEYVNGIFRKVNHIATLFDDDEEYQAETPAFGRYLHYFSFIKLKKLLQKVYVRPTATKLHYYICRREREREEV